LRYRLLFERNATFTASRPQVAQGAIGQSGMRAPSASRFAVQGKSSRLHPTQCDFMLRERLVAVLRGQAFPANTASEAPFRPQKRVERGFCFSAQNANLNL